MSERSIISKKLLAICNQLIKKSMYSPFTLINSELEILLQVAYHLLNEREKDAASSTRKETVPEVQVMQFCSIYEQQWQACSRRMGRSGEDHEGNGGSKGDAPCKPTWSKERESQNSYC